MKLIRFLLRRFKKGRDLLEILDGVDSLWVQWTNAKKPESEGGVELSPRERDLLLGRAMDLLGNIRRKVLGEVRIQAG